MKKLFIIILVLIMAVLLISEINSYKISNSIAQKKVCSFNRNKIYEATQSFLMENSKIHKTVTIEQLIKNKFLKEKVTCPLQGKYSIKIVKTNGEDFDIEIYCSIHKKNK